MFYYSLTLLSYILAFGTAYWIGAYEPQDGEGWFWDSTNANLNEGYTNWATDDSTDPDQKCVMRRRDTPWFDDVCDRNNYVLCEYP